MRRALSALMLGACLSSACDVGTVAQVPSAIVQNKCQSDSDCPTGSCTDSQCQSHKGTLLTVLFQVTPPSGTLPSAGLQFLKQVDLAPAGGELSLSLDPVSQITGEVTIARKCTPAFDDNGTVLASSADSSIPAVISLTPVQGALGVFSPPSVVQTTLINSSYYAYSVNVPPGDYDIYVQPLNQKDETCIVPPRLVRAWPVQPGQTLRILLPEPLAFEFHVTWPLGDGMLSGWTVDMLDPISGRVISNRAQLAVSASGKTDYVATVYYLPVENDASEVDELLRLSPPGGVTAPSVLLARSALGLFDANRGTLSQFTALPTKVHVQGQVTALATPKPVAATVSLVATKITGIDPGVLASFVRTATVGVDGEFDLDLLPGSYTVSAIPSTELNSDPASSADSKLAEATQQWLVADSPSPQAGKVIELSQALPINGQAFDAAFSTPVTTALVQAVASSASIKTDVLHQALGEAASVPRAATGSVLSTGDFSLIADTGRFDLSVQPLAATGFGWLVVPGVDVGTTPESSGGANLGTRGLPLPVLYHGTVTEPGSKPAPDVVPGALIRAYVYTALGEYTATASKADSLVQIAEARADPEGQFTLLIPASLKGSVR